MKTQNVAFARNVIQVVFSVTVALQKTAQHVLHRLHKNISYSKCVFQAVLEASMPTMEQEHAKFVCSNFIVLLVKFTIW